MVGKVKENIGLLLKHIKHHFKRTKNKYTGSKSVLLFPIIGLLSLLWVIVRVGTKPSRLRYPCMKVAVPTATTFVAYIIAIFTSLFSFRKARENLRKSRYSLAIILLLVSIAGGTFLILHTNQYASAQTVNLKTRELEANQPMGEEKGIFPGRVVWVHDPDATDETCNPWNQSDGWYKNENNDQGVIDAMLDTAVMALSEQSTVANAWDAFFKYNNSNRSKGNVGYQSGEIIFIKINRTSAYSIAGDFSRINYQTSETSPHVILALLKHLVDEVGVAEEDIYIGDPMKHIYKLDYELWHGEFPDIHYLDHNRSDAGREVAEVGSSMIHYSDSGEVLREGWNWGDASSGDPIYDDYFYAIFDDCDYLINVPTLKGHKRAGVTMFAKNHFGSHTRSSAQHLHMGLVVPDEYPNEQNARYGYGKYRVLVDLLSWELLREKSVIYLMDALWSAGWELDAPSKWVLSPFNNDWSSSIFISQDPVAIESVGYDFLRTEYTSENHPGNTYPQLEGADDHIEQAADSDNWPSGIEYDPENDGTPIPSLGVHEHWNNATDRQYSRNLGENYGIELVSILSSQGGVAEDIETLAKPMLYQNSPNPFKNFTSIKYNIADRANVELLVYNTMGQKIKTLVNENQPQGTYSVIWDASQENGSKAPNGVYIYRLTVITEDGVFEDANKMLLIK
ncbi:DUF362 domain-containing protein [candidate division WOR-3 bacterium]|nr:DUF362 domain-containing protein [candidate division WOR-3 bacterium]